MSIEIATSVNKVPIRMTDERWVHIIENHDDLAGYYDEVLSVVEYPDYIISGYRDALIALRRIVEGKFLAVIYKETSNRDGFIITAYFTNKIRLEREEIVWQRRK